MGVRVDTPEGAKEVVDGVKGVAREATANPAFEGLLRLGYVARGLVYGVIGLLALKVVTGGRGQFTDTQGAIAAISRTQWGDILLYVILAGLIGYGLLGLIRAILDPLRKGNDAKGIVERLGYAVSGISYFLLGLATYNLIRGAAAAARNGAQGQQLRNTAGTILSKPWGPWVIGLLGVVVIGIGVVQIVRAGSRNFDRQFQPFALSGSQRTWIDRIGRFGAAARGVVFALVGVFLFQAAYFHDPKKAQGIDGVLASLLHQPYGLYLLAVVALGLIAFAVYSALSALWLRLPRPAEMLNEADKAGSTLPAHGGALDRSAGGSLRSPGLLGRWPLLGLFLVVLGLSAFAFFAFNVQTNGPLVRDDLAVANALHRDALASPAWLRDLMVSGYYFGQHVIIAIGIVLALYFIYHRFWPELAMVAIAWAGEGSLWLLLSAHFKRARPVFPEAVFHTMTAPSFPSGHTLSAVMCYGLLAYLIVPRIRPAWGKAAVIALAVLMVLFIGFSRIFIGDHWLTDVLAGLVLGIAWASLVYTAVELVARSRTRQRGKAPAA